MVYTEQITVASAVGVPWLSILVAAPFVAALLLWLVKPLRTASREIALVVSLAVLAGVLVMAFTAYDPSAAAGSFQLGETYAWIPALGLSWALGVNGLGLVMIILAVALTPLVLLAAWSEDDSADSRAGYAGHILALESFMILLFAARDLLLFYIAFEAMLIPLYFLVGRYGRGEAAQRRHAAIKFVLYSLAGGLVMLFGVIGIYIYGPGGSQAFLMDNLTKPGAIQAGSMGMLLMLSFFAAFAIKAPLVPVHTWLPTAAEVARGGTSTLLVGVLDKVGTWGMIVMCWPLFPAESQAVAPIIIVLAVVSILWGALAAIAQKDLLRLVSFTSISHFGYMVMALYVGSQSAIEGAMLYMVAHGVSIAALFLLGGWLSEKAGTQTIADFRGFQRVTPVLAGLFLISGLAAIGLPGLSGFLPEYLILVGTFQVNMGAALVSVLGVVLAAVYILLPYQTIFAGPIDGKVRVAADLNLREKLIMAPLVLAMFGLGFLPGPTLKLIAPDAMQLSELSLTEYSSFVGDIVPVVADPSEGSTK